MTKKSQGRGSSRSKGKKFETLSGNELQGRGGEALPAHEKTLLGDEQDWERDDDEVRSPSTRRVSRQDRNRVVEVEYERGPGSKFQIEGRGVPRSKRQRAKRSK